MSYIVSVYKDGIIQDFICVPFSSNFWEKSIWCYLILVSKTIFRPTVKLNYKLKQY